MNVICFCPACKEELSKGDEALICKKCSITYQVNMGIPILKTTGGKFSDQEDWVDITRNATGYEFDSSSIIKYLEFLGSLKQRYEKVLDLGCGGGSSSDPITKISETLYCVDLSLKALMILKKRNLENAIPINGCLEELPFPDDFFDLIVSIAVIEHVNDASAMLQEVKRVLKPGGQFLLRNDALLHGILEKLRILPGRIGVPPDPTHIIMITPKSLAKLLLHHDFHILRKWYLPLGNYSDYLNIDLLSPFAIKGQFLCTVHKD